MMMLNQRQRNSLRDFFQNASRLDLKVSAELYQYLIDYYEEFLPKNHTLKGRTLRFSESQKQQLKSVLLENESDLFIKPLTSQNRVDVSAYSSNEKSALLAPESQHVLVTNHVGYIPLCDQNLLFPNDLSIRIPVSHIKLDTVECVVVVENLDILDCWSQVNWSQRPRSTIAVYRGHEKSHSRGMKALINSLPVTVPVVMFSDCDPAGIKIGLTLPRIDAFLAPVDMQSAMRSCNLPNEYVAQQEAVNFIRQHPRYACSTFLPMFNRLYEPLAMRQQHLIVRDVALQLYAV